MCKISENLSKYNNANYAKFVSKPVTAVLTFTISPIVAQSRVLIFIFYFGKDKPITTNFSFCEKFIKSSQQLTKLELFKLRTQVLHVGTRLEGLQYSCYVLMRI